MTMTTLIVANPKLPVMATSVQPLPFSSLELLLSKGDLIRIDRNLSFFQYPSPVEESGREC